MRKVWPHAFPTRLRENAGYYTGIFGKCEVKHAILNTALASTSSSLFEKNDNVFEELHITGINDYCNSTNPSSHGLSLHTMGAFGKTPFAATLRRVSSTPRLTLPLNCMAVSPRWTPYIADEWFEGIGFFNTTFFDN